MILFSYRKCLGGKRECISMASKCVIPGFKGTFFQLYLWRRDTSKHPHGSLLIYTEGFNYLTTLSPALLRSRALTSLIPNHVSWLSLLQIRQQSSQTSQTLPRNKSSLNKALISYLIDVRTISVNTYNFSQRKDPTDFIKLKRLKMSYDRKQFSEIVATKPHWQSGKM